MILILCLLISFMKIVTFEQWNSLYDLLLKYFEHKYVSNAVSQQEIGNAEYTNKVLVNTY